LPAADHQMALCISIIALSLRDQYLYNF